MSGDRALEKTVSEKMFEKRVLKKASEEVCQVEKSIHAHSIIEASYTCSSDHDQWSHGTYAYLLHYKVQSYVRTYVQQMHCNIAKETRRQEITE